MTRTFRHQSRRLSARLSLAALGMAALALSACSTPSNTSDGSASPPLMTVSGPGPLTGHWEVMSVHPSGITPLPPSAQHALIGQMVTLTATMAKDVSGRTCPAPSYQFATLPQSQVMDFRQPMGMADPLATEVWVNCHGAPFARFVVLASGVVLSEHHGTWAALTQSANPQGSQGMHQDNAVETHALPMMATAPHTASQSSGHGGGHDGGHGGGHSTTPAAHGSSMGHGGGMMAHLASYRGEGMAREGWAKLLSMYSELRAFHPTYEKITLDGKGTFVRLMAQGSSPQQVEQLCQALKQQGAYCMVMKGH